MAKNIFLASTSPDTGKSVVCLGLINALRGIVSSVGYFKPIGEKFRKNEKFDKESIMIKEIFDIDDDLEFINPVSISELKQYVKEERNEIFYQKIQESYKKIQEDKDIVVVDGTDHLGMISAFELDINTDIANNLNAGVILIEDGYKQTAEEIASNVFAGKDSFRDQACDMIGVIVNKIEEERLSEVREDLEKLLHKKNIDLFGVIPFNSVLPKPRLNDIAKSLDAEVLFGAENLTNIAIENVITSMEFENALKYIHEGSLIITGGDRNEILLGSIASSMTFSYPSISGIVLTGGLLPDDNIRKLIGDFSGNSIPILSVKTNTLETANKIGSLTVYLSSGDNQKIDIAKSLISQHVNYEKINDILKIEKIKKRTPDIFKYELIERARSKKMRIVLPEGDEERTLKAVESVREREISDIILLGDPDVIQKKANNIGVSLDSKIEIINPMKSSKFEDYVKTYMELRKHKHYTEEIAHDRIQDPIYFGTMMIYMGDADGLISGAVHTTQHTIRPAFEIVKTRPKISIASSVFLMCLKDRVLVYGDCAVNPNPNAEQLAVIAVSSADTAKSFEIEPLVAMLSYSTGKSGKGPEVEQVREATRIAKEMRPDLLIEGPIQYDAAVDPHVASVKMPESKVAGRATVFIFPDLNTGNNTYKAVQRSSGAVAIGPVLQGLNKPVNDLSRGCLVEDIIYTVAITAIQAQNV